MKPLLDSLPQGLHSFGQWGPPRNQIYLATLMCLTVDTSFIFTKKSNVEKKKFDICNAEMAQSLSSLQKSEFLKLIILIFHIKKIK